MTKLNIPTTTGPKIAPDAIGSPRIHYLFEKVAECRKCLKRLKTPNMEGIKLFEAEKKRMLIETYCGYDIMRFYDGHLQQGYYYIAINRERESALALASPLAARNVINTHLRNISENQKPIYK